MEYFDAKKTKNSLKLFKILIIYVNVIKWGGNCYFLLIELTMLLYHNLYFIQAVSKAKKAAHAAL